MTRVAQSMEFFFEKVKNKQCGKRKKNAYLPLLLIRIFSLFHDVCNMALPIAVIVNLGIVWWVKGSKNKVCWLVLEQDVYLFNCRKSTVE